MAKEKGKDDLTSEVNYWKSLYEKQRTEAEKLKEQLYRLEYILSKIPSHVYWLDKNNVYIGCNKAHAKTVGINSEKDVAGMRNSDMPWKDQAELMDKLNNEIMTLGEAQKREEYTKIDGVTRYYISEKNPLRDQNDEICGIVGISVEITEIKQLQEQLQKAKDDAELANLAKTKFITNMSHDIRTPLSGIVGLSTVLMGDAVTETNKENARLLNLSSEQLLSLLNAVLELIASESFEQTIEESSFDLKSLINDLFELELPALKLKDITLDLKFDEQLPAVIKTDKGKLYRVLLNLLSNAIKFTNTSGSITLKIEQVSRDADKATLRFSVLDTGIGIPKTEIDKIFNAFYRVHPSYEGNYEGLGVGLHLVRQYVELLKGDIEVKSIEGMGTQFKLTVPVEITQQVNDNIPLPDIKVDVQQEKPKADNQANQAPSPPCESGQHKILLVEDNPMAMQVAKSMLSKYPFEIYKATTATDALNLFIENDIDIVLSDIGLPDFSGFELAKKMREQKENCPPIIGLTAHAKQQAALEGQQSGMIEVFEKPLSPEKIEILLSHISEKERPEEKSKEASATLPLLDVELAISYLGSQAELKEMLTIMLNQSMTETTDLINKAYQEQNLDELKKSAHKFKSSCLYCATTLLLHHTQKLEGTTANQDPALLKQTYDEFQKALEATKKHIEQWLLAH